MAGHSGGTSIRREHLAAALAELLAADGDDAILSCLTRYTATLGFDGMMLATRCGRGAWRSLSTWAPDFHRTYFGDSGIAPNPVSLRLASTHEVVWWGQPVPWTSKAERAFLDAAKQAGIGQAVSIPLFDRIGLATTAHFSTPGTDIDPAAEQILFQLAEMFHLSATTQPRPDGDNDDDAILSPREIEVLTISATGLRNREIGETLGITTHAVEFHFRNIFAKLEVSNRVSAVTKAIKLGLIISG